jgi:uncharacterized alpha-E superfamily protein
VFQIVSSIRNLQSEIRNMLSRVAENLYWIGRYVERAENVARLLDDGFQSELDSGLVGEGHAPGSVEGLLGILACRAEFEAVSAKTAAAVTGAAGLPVFPVARPRPPREEVLEFLTFGRGGCHSIQAMVAAARENARTTQEVLSTDAWRQVNRMYLYLSGRQARRRFRSSSFRFFDAIKRACVLFGGLVDSTLPRTEVFHFLQLGRYLERLDMVSRILNVNLPRTAGDAALNGAIPEGIHWTSLLRSCAAYQAYLREFQDRIEPANVVRYLVLGADFPRSLRFCVARCLESLREIAGGGDDDGYATEAERLLGRLDSDLRYLEPDEVLGRGLYGFLSAVQETCNRVGVEIQQAYFLQ